jgi:hypothetical protein
MLYLFLTLEDTFLLSTSLWDELIQEEGDILLQRLILCDEGRTANNFIQWTKHPWSLEDYL